MRNESPMWGLVTVSGGAQLPRWALVLALSALGVGTALLIAHAFVVSAIAGAVLIAVGLLLMGLTFR